MTVESQGTSSGIESEELGQSGEVDSQGNPISPSAQDGTPSGDTGTEDPSVTAAPGAKDFQHPLLKGKSPEQIERLFTTQENAVKEQNAELNRLHNEVSRRDSAPPPSKEEDDSPYGDDFLAPRFKTLEQRVAKMISDSVEPLREETRRGQLNTVREKLRSELRHFTIMEPHIDKLLRDQGRDPTTVSEASLRTFYHTAVGLATEAGLDLNVGSGGTEPTTPAGGSTVPAAIPQHRPSSAPLPPSGGGRQVRRQLTENEKRLAREYYPNSQDPEGDYLKDQSAEEDEVVTPGFSKELW